MIWELFLENVTRRGTGDQKLMVSWWTANTTHIFKSVWLFFNAVQSVPLASNNDVWNARFVGFDLTNSTTISSGCHSWKTYFFLIRSVNNKNRKRWPLKGHDRLCIWIYIISILVNSYLAKPLDRHCKMLVSNE